MKIGWWGKRSCQAIYGGVRYNLVDEMIVFACFWDGSGSQAEAVCRINASGGKQKMERRVRA
jgi:hypothetical protein